MLKRSTETRHVCAGTSHVEADDRSTVGLRVGCPGIPDVATSRTAKNGVDTGEASRVLVQSCQDTETGLLPLPARQAAITHHEIALDGLFTLEGTLEATPEPVDVSGRLRGEIGISCCTEAAADEFDRWAQVGG